MGFFSIWLRPFSSFLCSPFPAVIFPFLVESMLEPLLLSHRSIWGSIMELCWRRQRQEVVPSPRTRWGTPIASSRHRQAEPAASPAAVSVSPTTFPAPARGCPFVTHSPVVLSFPWPQNPHSNSIPFPSQGQLGLGLGRPGLRV